VAVSDTQAFTLATRHLTEGSVELMVLHGPPDNSGVLGKRGKALPGVAELASRVQPKVLICAHAHNPDVADLSQGRSTMLENGTLAVNCACLGTWNQPHGTAVVIDRLQSN